MSVTTRTKTPTRDGRKRILLLLNSLAVGGAETFAVDFAATVDRSRFDIVVGYFRGEEVLGPRLREAAVPLMRFPELRRSLDLRPLRALHRYLRRERVDVIQTHLPYSGLLGRVVGRAAGVPVIVSTEQLVLTGQSPPNRRVEELTLALVDTIVCISEGVLESLAQEGSWGRLSSRVPRIVIPNGVDMREADRRLLRRDRNLRIVLGLSETDFVIGNIGRLVEQKGQRALIEALPMVLREIPEAQLLLVGKGPLEQELLALARACGVPTRVHLTGERTDVFELMGVMDVFAFPSNFEGLGIVLLEALAARLPVVASQIPGVVDVIEDGVTGVLLPPRDPASLAREIVALSRHPARARLLAENGRRRVEERFSLDVVTRRYEALYTELLARKGR